MKALILTALLMWAVLPSASAQSFQEIRFFKVNKKQQQREMSFIRKRSETGCQSVSLKRHVHRVQIIGFKSCQIYAQPDCAADSLVSFKWTGRRAPKGISKDTPMQTLTVGSRWMADPQPDQVFRSWQCQ